MAKIKKYTNKFFKQYLLDMLDNRKAKIQNSYDNGYITKIDLENNINDIDNVTKFVTEQL